MKPQHFQFVIVLAKCGSGSVTSFAKIQRVEGNRCLWNVKEFKVSAAVLNRSSLQVVTLYKRYIHAIYTLYIRYTDAISKSNV